MEGFTEQLKESETAAKRLGFVQAQNKVVDLLIKEYHLVDDIETKDLLHKIMKEVFDL